MISGEGEPTVKEGVGVVDDDPVIVELLEGARKVLKSGNQVAVEALERNIRYFAHTIEMEGRMSTMESELVAIKEDQEGWRALLKKDDLKKSPAGAGPSTEKKKT